MLNLFRSYRGRQLVEATHRLAGQNQQLQTGEIAAWQLDALNQVWRHYRKVPMVQRNSQLAELHSGFESLEQFRRLVPVTSREEFRADPDSFVDRDLPIAQHRATGGSTGVPIRFPVSAVEIQRAGAAAWLARSWIGVSPAQRLFLLWGHSHLFGRGIRGWVNRQRRVLADYVLGYYRWSAYDMSREALRQAADRLINFRPQWCLGYSVAWDRFADANADRAGQLRDLQLKAVVATAEAFPHADSRKRLQDLFGCPVLMEYGTVETGVLAQETAAGNYRVVWQNHLVEAVPNPDTPGRSDVLVTSLYPRCVPLLRYRIGDQVSCSQADESLVSFEAVAGRCNDFLQTPSGNRIHSELIAHIIRDLPGLRGYQAVQLADGQVQLNLLSSTELSESVRHTIRERLARVDRSLAEISVTRVSELRQSVAGKTPTVVRA